MTKPSCQYSAEMCLGEQSFHFLHTGPCRGDYNLDWAIERAKLSMNSLKKVSCGYDTCYDWEECPGMISQWWYSSSPLDLKIKHADSFTVPRVGFTAISAIYDERSVEVWSVPCPATKCYMLYMLFSLGTTGEEFPLCIS